MVVVVVVAFPLSSVSVDCCTCLRTIPLIWLACSASISFLRASPETLPTPRVKFFAQASNALSSMNWSAIHASVTDACVELFLRPKTEMVIT